MAGAGERSSWKENDDLMTIVTHKDYVDKTDTCARLNSLTPRNLTRM